jgi:aryl-alcohol dehydrogenase-like predicted oxidoreductase
VEGIRKEVFIATKCGLVWNEKRRVRNNIQPDSILEEAEASLRRLNTDYIDLYQIHWPDGQTPVEKSWEAMVKLKNQGKVRFIGVSNFDKSMLEKCEKIFHVNSLQPPYSLLNREVEKEILPWCKVHGIGVVAYSPMQSGLLTDSFDISRLAPDDWRHKSSYFQEPNLSKNLEFTKRLGEIAARYNKTVAQLAIAWVLNNSVVSSAIVGARKPEQVDEIVGGAAWSITREDLDLIENLSTEIL